MKIDPITMTVLYFYCQSEALCINDMKTFLKKNEEKLDLTCGEGRCFITAIRNQNPELLEVLLKFLEETHLSQEKNSASYVSAVQCLEKVEELLTDEEDPIEFKVSASSWKIIHQYLDDNSDVNTDLDRSEDLYVAEEYRKSSDEKNNDMEDSSILTEENLQLWNKFCDDVTQSGECEHAAENTH